MTKWIACAERLPELKAATNWTEESDEVLGFSPSLPAGRSTVLRLARDRRGDDWSALEWRAADGAPIDLGCVTHWMPLPAPPVAQAAPQEATHAD